MSKIIYLFFYIASFVAPIASLVVIPAYALDETDEQNMTGSAVKILNKYEGRWKGWSDGCVNCDMPLVMEESFANKKRATKNTAKKKNREKSHAMEKKSEKSKDSNQITEKEKKATLVPKRMPKRVLKRVHKSLKRGYCGCNCDSEASKGTDCRNENHSDNSDTELKTESALGSESEKKSTKNDPEEADNKTSYNMDVRDTPRPGDNDAKDMKDNNPIKDKPEEKDNNNDNNNNGATGNEGIGASKDDASSMNEKAEKAGKEKSKFSIFSIRDSK